MIKNYLRIAVRGIVRHPGYAAINIFGLTLGITCFLLIFLVVKFELSFDQFHKKAENIFRIDNALNLSSGVYKYPNGPSAFGPALLREVPEVEAYTRLNGGGQQVIFKIGNEIFKEDQLFYADPNFFEFFNFKLIFGSPVNLLKAPLQAVLSEKAAVKYFGKVNVIGEILELKGNQDQRFIVTGVFENLPANTHLKFEILLSNETLKTPNNPNGLENWRGGGFFSFIKLRSPQDFALVEEKLITLRDKNVEESTRNNVNPSLIKLTDIHLKSNLRNEMAPNGNLDSVYVFSAIAVFILLIAAINYMNLATARSAKRAKEVGVRKVLGAYKEQLIGQFMGESILITAFSAVLSFAIVAAMLRFMAQFTGKALTLDMLFSGQVFGLLLIIILVVGFGSGIYPALFLSSFKPAVVLKGKMAPGMNSSGSLRKALVVFQFAISIALTIGTYTVYQQLNFMQNKSLGFQKDNMLVISNTRNALTPSLSAFKNELLKNTGVESVAASFSKPGGLRPIIFIQSETVIDDEDNLNLAGINVDFDYMKTFGISIIKGRDFDAEIPNDSTQSIIINQQAALELNMGENPVGKMIQIRQGNEWVNKWIIGLVENVNFEPLQRKTESTFYAPFFGSYLYLYVRYREGASKNVVQQASTLWNDFAPEQPFDYSFLSDDLNELYSNEAQLSKVVVLFALLTMVIACLGLFGLASFSTEQRIKEIGIRKVLGASIAQVLLLLSRDFALLILIAFLIASPMAYYLSTWWLQNFAFKINLTILTFLIAGMGALMIALITISLKTWKAARSNPVNALRID
ncbi:MAG: putative ABC transport system permease protein [Candidatus Endobugula sp.]|jgi:putative ABC transport system permease protein